MCNMHILENYFSVCQWKQAEMCCVFLYLIDPMSDVICNIKLQTKGALNKVVQLSKCWLIGSLHPSGAAAASFTFPSVSIVAREM